MDSLKRQILLIVLFLQFPKKGCRIDSFLFLPNQRAMSKPPKRIDGKKGKDCQKAKRREGNRILNFLGDLERFYRDDVKEAEFQKVLQQDRKDTAVENIRDVFVKTHEL